MGFWLVAVMGLGGCSGGEQEASTEMVEEAPPMQPVVVDAPEGEDVTEEQLDMVEPPDAPAADEADVEAVVKAEESGEGVPAWYKTRYEIERDERVAAAKDKVLKAAQNLLSGIQLGKTGGIGGVFGGKKRRRSGKDNDAPKPAPAEREEAAASKPETKPAPSPRPASASATKTTTGAPSSLKGGSTGSGTAAETAAEEAPAAGDDAVATEAVEEAATTEGSEGSEATTEGSSAAVAEAPAPAPEIDACDLPPEIEGDTRLSALTEDQKREVCQFSTCGLGGYGQEEVCGEDDESGEPIVTRTYASEQACLDEPFWDRCANLTTKNYLACVQGTQKDPCGENRRSVSCAQVVACAAGAWTNPNGCKLPPPVRRETRLADLTARERGLLCDYSTCGYGGYGVQMECEGEKKPLEGPAERAECIANEVWGLCGELKVAHYVACMQRVGEDPCNADEAYRSNGICARVAQCVGRAAPDDDDRRGRRRRGGR